MGQIDVAKVITAAAASSLGVLSLIVLLVCFVGYNFFKGSGDRWKAGVWGVMLLAAVGFGVAVIRQGQVAANAPDPHPTPTPTSALTPVPEPAPSPVPTGAAASDLSGTWRDDDGFTYALHQNGGTLTYEQVRDGAAVGSGKGTISGRKVAYAYVDDRTLDRGTCTGLVAASGRSIDGSCTNGKHRWGFKIER